MKIILDKFVARQLCGGCSLLGGWAAVVSVSEARNYSEAKPAPRHIQYIRKSLYCQHTISGTFVARKLYHPSVVCGTKVVPLRSVLWHESCTENKSLFS
jgi:hypothetical protein